MGMFICLELDETRNLLNIMSYIHCYSKNIRIKPLQPVSL